MRKLISIFITVNFLANSLIPPSVSAQTLSSAVTMPQAGSMVSLSDAFTPAHLVGITIDPQNASSSTSSSTRATSQFPRVRSRPPTGNSSSTSWPR